MILKDESIDIVCFFYTCLTERAAGKQLRDDLYVTSVDLKKKG